MFSSLFQSVMDSSVAIPSPLSTSFSSVLPSTPRSAIRPLSAAYRNSGSDYQVICDLRIHFGSSLKSELWHLSYFSNKSVCLSLGGCRQTDTQERRQFCFQGNGVHVWLVTLHSALWGTFSLREECGIAELIVRVCAGERALKWRVFFSLLLLSVFFNVFVSIKFSSKV